jgi:hypothetical protein
MSDASHILAALIRMVQQGVGLATPPDRHDEGIRDKLCCHDGAHRPAYYSAGEHDLPPPSGPIGLLVD